MTVPDDVHRVEVKERRRDLDFIAEIGRHHGRHEHPDSRSADGEHLSANAMHLQNSAAPKGWQSIMSSTLDPKMERN